MEANRSSQMVEMRCFKHYMQVYLNKIIKRNLLDHLLPKDQQVPDYDITLGIDASRLPKT